MQKCAEMAKNIKFSPKIAATHHVMMDTIFSEISVGFRALLRNLGM